MAFFRTTRTANGCIRQLGEYRIINGVRTFVGLAPGRPCNENARTSENQYETQEEVGRFVRQELVQLPVTDRNDGIVPTGPVTYPALPNRGRETIENDGTVYQNGEEVDTAETPDHGIRNTFIFILVVVALMYGAKKLF